MVSDAPPYTLPDYASIEFPDPPDDRPYVLVNMVMSADGKTVIEDNEQGLGSEADQYLMRALRVHADVVMNGANTLRASGISPLIQHPALEAMRSARGLPPPIGAVLSGSGTLPLDSRFFISSDFDAVVFLGASAPEANRAAIAATGRRVVMLPADEPMQAMLRYLRRDLGARVLLVEGGAQLNGSLLDAGLVDELFFTVGGLIVGGDETRTPVSGNRPTSQAAVIRMELISAAPVPALDEVYLRYRIPHP